MKYAKLHDTILVCDCVSQVGGLQTVHVWLTLVIVLALSAAVISINCDKPYDLHVKIGTVLLLFSERYTVSKRLC